MDKTQKFVLIPEKLFNDQITSSPRQIVNANTTITKSPKKFGVTQKPKLIHNSGENLFHQPSEISTTLEIERPKSVSKSPPTPVDSKPPDLKEILLAGISKLGAPAKKILNALFDSEVIKFSLNRTIIVNNVDTGIPILSFVRKLRRKNAAINQNFFMILNALQLEPGLVINNDLLAKDVGEWQPFPI